MRHPVVTSADARRVLAYAHPAARARASALYGLNRATHPIGQCNGSKNSNGGAGVAGPPSLLGSSLQMSSRSL